MGKMDNGSFVASSFTKEVFTDERLKFFVLLVLSSQDLKHWNKTLCFSTHTGEWSNVEIFHKSRRASVRA